MKKHWKTYKFTDITTQIMVGIASAATHAYREAGVVLFRNQNIKENGLDDSDILFIDPEYEKIHKNKRLRSGDILIARTGYPGTASVVPEKYNGAQSFTTLIARPNSNLVDSVFLAYYLNSPIGKEYFESAQIGGGQKNVNAGTIEQMNLVIPELPEQRRIAKILSTWDEAIEQQTKLIELKEKRKKALMQKLLSGEVRFPGFEGEWEEKRLDEVANFRRGSFPQPYGLKKWYDEINGAPFIQVYDVGDNMLLKSTTKSKISKLGAEQSVFVKAGTLVLTIQGSIGRIAKTQYDAFVDRTLLIFQSYKKPIDIDYFKYVVFLLFEIEKTKAPGGTIKTITKEALSGFLILVPQIEEQIRIAVMLNSCDEELSVLKSELVKLNTQKQGMMQQLLTGKLRVNA